MFPSIHLFSLDIKPSLSTLEQKEPSFFFMQLCKYSSTTLPISPPFFFSFIPLMWVDFSSGWTPQQTLLKLEGKSVNTYTNKMILTIQMWSTLALIVILINSKHHPVRSDSLEHNQLKEALLSRCHQMQLNKIRILTYSMSPTCIISKQTY